MNILDIFFGTSQSKYAAFAIFSAIIAVCLLILFNSTDISISKRFTIVFFIILASIPSILFTLFELTCLVTGGTRKSNWWCYYFAWIIAAILIIYSIIVIISVFISLFTYNNAVSRLNDTENNKKISQTDANNYAKNIVESYDNSDVAVPPPNTSNHPAPAQVPSAPPAHPSAPPAHPSAPPAHPSASASQFAGNQVPSQNFGLVSSYSASPQVAGNQVVAESFDNSFGVRFAASEGMPLISSSPDNSHSSPVESFTSFDSSYALFQK